jgi:hypothetical protein
MVATNFDVCHSSREPLGSDHSLSWASKNPAVVALGLGSVRQACQQADAFPSLARMCGDGAARRRLIRSLRRTRERCRDERGRVHGSLSPRPTRTRIRIGDNDRTAPTRRRRGARWGAGPLE